MNVDELQAVKAARRDKQKFLKLRPIGGGPWCVCEPVEVMDLLDGDSPDKYETQEVWMTQAEYEALKDFEGW